MFSYVQSIPIDFSGGSFRQALIEIQDTADSRNAKSPSKASSGSTKHQASKVLQAYSSQNELVAVKGGAHLGDVIEQPLKRRKLKFKGMERTLVRDDEVNTPSKGKEAAKEVRAQDRSMETKSNRKRMAKLQTESDGDGAATRESLESSKKFGSPTLNSVSLSSRDLAKKARGKKTGADGVSFCCIAFGKVDMVVNF